MQHCSHCRARTCTSSFVTSCAPPAHPPLPPNIRLGLVARSKRAPRRSHHTSSVSDWPPARNRHRRRVAHRHGTWSCAGVQMNVFKGYKGVFKGQTGTHGQRSKTSIIVGKAMLTISRRENCRCRTTHGRRHIGLPSKGRWRSCSA